MLLPVRRRPDLPEKTVAPPPSALSASMASLLLPGGGQLWQGRWATGVVHLMTCAAFAITAMRIGGNGWWGLGALAVNVLSSGEAGWWARGSGADPDPPSPDVTE